MKATLKLSQNKSDTPKDRDPAGRLFPFCAVIGQKDLKLALILNAVNPGIGGVLIRGEKGTAKSTIVRALADLLPEITVRRGCGFNCSPGDPCPACGGVNGTGSLVTRRKAVVTLPLNATEDRVAGGLDFEQALKQGKRMLLPGLLAKAHRGILYVDEINLLDDHIVDIILDAAASGENRVEREGISLSHPSRFLLVGTMNPEEGDLRPQLLDRFGFCVEVAGETDPEQRVALMLQRDAFDLDPEGFRKTHEPATRELSQRIQRAEALLPAVRMPGHLRAFIAELSTSHHVAGHRADLVIEQGAVAHAALKGRTEVLVEDIQAVSLFALLHRKQEESDPPPPPKDRDPEDQPPPESDPPENKEEEQAPPPPDDPPAGEEEPPPMEDQEEDQEEDQDESEDREMPPQPKDQDDKGADTLFEIGEPFKVKKIETGKDRTLRRGSGRRSRTRVSQKQGRYVKSTLNLGRRDIAFDATLRAAAPFQKNREIPEGMCVALTPGDIREKIREKKMGNFLLFLVDASGSMGARGRMTASKGAILSLLLDAYQKRDRVAMISFRKTEGVINLPVTSSIELAAQYLAEMPVGGRTPLSAGLDKAYGMIKSVQYRDPASRPIVIIITDGRTNLALGEGRPVDEALGMAARMGEDERVTYIVVDTETQGPVMFGLARELAQAAGARYYKIDDLKSDTLVSLVKENR